MINDCFFLIPRCRPTFWATGYKRDLTGRPGVERSNVETQDTGKTFKPFLDVGGQ